MLFDHLYNNRKEKKQPKEKNESHYRSMVKAISWRALGTLDTILISWLISGEFSIAFSIGAFELLTKTFLYYFHERLWSLTKWGK